MIYNASEYNFKAPEILSRARRVLIKPCARYPVQYPVSTSRELIQKIISGIRRISDADIIILEGAPGGAPVKSIYKALSYDFQRVVLLDVNDCTWVEVDNPLNKPLVVPTFWVSNVILSSDFLISVTPLQIINGKGNFSISNLLPVLPSGKYGSGKTGWDSLYSQGIEKVLSDLYFTLPFDMGIIEATQKFTSHGDPTKGEIEHLGKIFAGEPYEVDTEVSRTLNIKTDYLELITTSSVELERWT
ncbi:hypothetical protein CVH13_01032 [Dehalococcoides mccartyi]|uniref:DUF362 domain-containing protein n=1 Tax=Dehalococcoides mccartyi TaxID=61435 RepID=A0A2J1DWT1_9CHLR|nr:hypothetical protein CVH13_01032 [Dehalococcoides mccartyi]